MPVYNRAADTRSEDHRTVPARRRMGCPIARMSGKKPQLRLSHSDQPGEEKTLGAESNWPSLVTTDRYGYAGYCAFCDPVTSPESQ